MQNGKSQKHIKSAEVIDKLLGGAAEKGKQAFGSMIGETGEILSDKLDALKKKASDLGLDEVADEIQNYVKKNPWKSLGIAVGLGFLVKSFFRPSRREE